jgi:hypothetical protein
VPGSVHRRLSTSLPVSTRMSACAAVLLMAGCASPADPVAEPMVASAGEIRAPAGSEPAPPTPEVYFGMGERSEILRIVVRPMDSQMWLLERSFDAIYTPLLESGARVGTDTIIPGERANRTAVLYVQREGYVPVAIEFVPNFLADLFPELRPVPEPGIQRPLNEGEALAAEVWRELQAQFGAGGTPAF